ncbi:diguanylate cyclase [Microvirga sp. GCM10011540]|uniref:sensor domain-containing diguanylate cyclase n=1 Tax=Microvirga sp. GCM10011540 TaxID=3317338 RepID=UPI003622A292
MMMWTKPLPLKLYLNLFAAVIALSIVALSGKILWDDHRRAWSEAKQSSLNLLTALARDLGGNIALLDLSLRGVIQDLNEQGFEELSPELRHRMLFDRAATAAYMGSVLVLNASGQVIADAEAVTPRKANFGDRDYFKVHQERPDIGLYVSRAYKSRFRSGDLSIAVSRRLTHADGSFAGVVMGAISLAKVQALFRELNLGWAGTINLFREDGILLMRCPFDEGQINQDFSRSPHVQRLLQGGSGTFESVSPIDGVNRLISFKRLEGLPLVLTVAQSVDEIFAPWVEEAATLGFVTIVVSSSVIGLTLLFQRELNRRVRAEAKLRRIARTDDLTGLPNRRGFRETFEREWRQAIRSGRPLSLLYIDADFFKDFNDRYGHGHGDEVLRALARALEANIRRPRDIAARHGGEEFAVMLPETDLAGARVIAENIRQAVMALGIVHEESPYHVVTVSIGVAAARPPRGSVAASLLTAADAALYQAKADGRNAVHISERSIPSEAITAG